MTVKLKAVSGAAVAGALTAKCVAAAAWTEMPALDALRVPSDAVSVWMPAVTRKAEKVPVPLVSVLSAGRPGELSLLVK